MKIKDLKRLFIIISGIIILSNENTFDQLNIKNPSYAAHIEYTSGNFGTYKYPTNGDSVVLYLGASTNVIFKVYNGKNINEPRSFEIDFKTLKLFKRKMYNDIVSIDKTIPTGNYDVSFSSEKGDIAVNLTHFGAGNIADLTVIIMHDEVRIDDIFIAHLIKLKQNK